MPTIFAIGETIYDIIFKNSQPVAARPGGSMLNTAVSLGRCGLKVEMITEVGADTAGQIVLDFLMENGVSTSYVRPAEGFKTPVALAFLDEGGNATYSFYNKYPESRLDLIWPEPTQGDVVLFGAFYSLDPAIRHKISRFVKNAKHNGAFIVYDPNIRKNHLRETIGYMGFIEENFAMTDIVRGSDEDFENLFGLAEGEKVFERVKDAGCKYLIYTRNSRGAELFSEDLRLHIPAGKIEVVSTIGAGDSFNAGIIFGIVSKRLAGSDLQLISAETWKVLIGFGINFASDVCQSFDNYVSIDLVQKIKK
jgi:fructokinase